MTDSAFISLLGHGVPPLLPRARHNKAEGFSDSVNIQAQTGGAHISDAAATLRGFDRFFKTGHFAQLLQAQGRTPALVLCVLLEGSSRPEALPLFLSFLIY